MNKFIVWCPGRCGSRLVTQVIQNYYADLFYNVYYTDYDATVYTGDLPIVHTHSVDLILSNIPGFMKIAIHRNIFDSVLSKAIMDHTRQAHIDDPESLQSFQRRFAHRKFTIRQTDFENYCKIYDEQYQQVFESKQDIKILRYEDFQQDPRSILNDLGLDVTVDHGLPLTLKIPLDKESVITNLDELIQIYDGLDLRYRRMV